MLVDKVSYFIRFVFNLLLAIFKGVFSLAIKNESKSKNSRKNNTFKYSGESSLLEEYPCFDDKSNLNWIDGKEVLENPHWNENQKRLWYYFYRPYNYGDNIAGNQKRSVREMKASIIEKTSQLKIFKLIVLIVVVLTVVMIFSKNPSIFFIIASIILTFYFLFVHAVTESEISSYINGIVELNHEIDFLVDKQQDILKNILTSHEVEKIFWNDMVNIEKSFISSALNKDYDAVKRDARSYYSEKMINDFFAKNEIEPPVFPLIPSWGLLQQSYVGGSNGSQKTGLYILNREIGKKVATWRNTSTGKSFYRVSYIQFLFFQEKALHVVSIYYDFITKKQSGVRKEMFPYNHISHHSNNEEDLSHMMLDPLIKGLNLPEELTNNIYDHQTKAIAFSSSSGSSYKCVLPDKDVSNGLKKWLNYKKKKSYTSDTLSQEDKQELNNNLVERDEIIFTLAEATYNELGRKIEKFAIREKFNDDF